MNSSEKNNCRDDRISQVVQGGGKHYLYRERVKKNYIIGNDRFLVDTQRLSLKSFTNQVKVMSLKK